MAILFLTGSLEPGKDGVGDYTRLLAFECARQDQACWIIALNDPFVSEVVEMQETQGDHQICILRLPAALPWPARIELTAAFQVKFQAAWTSLQLVPYAFHPKGLVNNLARYLTPIADQSYLHIMFHELWIGVGDSPSFKDRIIGQVQRRYVRQMIRKLRPRLITTTNPFYASLLLEIGQTAKVIPLFGNIPILANQHSPLSGFSQCLFFGSLYPEWKPEPFMSAWISACSKKQKRPRLISAGRRGQPGSELWKKLQTRYGASVEFIDHGECSELQISDLMQQADFGLATSPWHLLGKSGSTTAMLEHGLPVIVTRGEFQPGFTLEDPLLHGCDQALESKLVAGLPKRPAQSRLGNVARNFLGELRQAEPKKGACS